MIISCLCVSYFSLFCLSSALEMSSSLRCSILCTSLRGQQVRICNTHVHTWAQIDAPETHPSTRIHACMHSHYCHGNDEPQCQILTAPRCLFPLHLQFHSCFGLLVCGTSSWQSLCLLHWARTLSMGFSLWRQHRPLQPMM